MLFWLSITVSILCILKTAPTLSVGAPTPLGVGEKYNGINFWDGLFLLSSWQLFNLKVWQNYIAGFLDYSYAISATLCFLLAVLYAKRRGLGINYSLSYSELKRVGKWIVFLAAILIPLGMQLSFLRWNPNLDLHFAIQTAVGYFLFVATVEEIIFRGIIYNLLCRSIRREFALIITTILFAVIATHIASGNEFPNYRYVTMAFVAGLAYGLAYMKTGSIVAPIIIHGSVDTIWRIFLS